MFEQYKDFIIKVFKENGLNFPSTAKRVANALDAENNKDFRDSLAVFVEKLAREQLTDIVEPDDNKLVKEIHYNQAVKLYSENKNATKTAMELCDTYNITYTETEGRKVRSWLSNIHPNVSLNGNPKILIYDIETCRVRANVWWTGKQFISHDQLLDEPKIITIAYKWLGEDKKPVCLTWDENQCDKKMLNFFLETAYNVADVAVGQNSDRFDNRFVNARAMKHGLQVNEHIKSFDLMKESKRLFRLPSYSMAYVSKYLDIEGKADTGGISLWDKVQSGDKDALQRMCEYNVQDVLVTEQMYLRLRKYMQHQTHLGVIVGNEKWSCPECGGYDVEHYKTIVTKAGTVQHLLQCKVDKVKFKISNRDFTKWMEG